MSLFAACRRWMTSHTSRKRVHTYLVTAFLVAITALVPCGTLTAQAAGLSHNAQLVASASAPTTPSITLNPQEDSPTKPFTVDGMGFAPNVQVKVQFQGKRVFSTITSPSGTFSATIKVPKDPGGQYTVLAAQKGGLQAQAVFTIIAAFSSLKPRDHKTVWPNDPICTQIGLPPFPGQPLKLGAWGEPANAPYQVEWQTQDGSNTMVMASGTTTSKGMLSASFNVPAEQSEFYTLLVDIPSPHTLLTAIYDSGTASCFIYNEPGDGYIHYQWDGVGWDATSTVSFNFNGSTIRQDTTDQSGSFGTDTFTQQCPPPGTYQGSISGTVDFGQPLSIPFNPPVIVNSGC